MNLNSDNIKIILFTLDILERYKNNLVPNDKIEMISKYINRAKTNLRKQKSNVDINVVSVIHLSCTIALMIAKGELNSDVFTISKCKEYENKLISLVDELDYTIHNLQ